MTFIGIIAEKKYEKGFQKGIKKCFENVNAKLIIVAINEENITNIKKIQFETIIIDRNLEGTNKYFKEILKNAKYVLLNSDVVDIQKIQNMNLNVITYGFGSKCTITASSNEDNIMMVCLQRSINNISNKKIEPQELQIKNVNNDDNQYINMVNGAIKLIYL